jgi:uncharacterized membrane protein YagU involved in acid resistance
VLFHLLTSFVIAGVFILIAAFIPLLRRYPFAASLLYSIGAFIVMNFIALPLSAAPPLPAWTLPQLIESIVEPLLVVGLPLGTLVRQDAAVKQ